MYKIYSTVIRMVNTLYTVLFVSLIIGLFLVSAGAYIKSKIKHIDDKVICNIFGIEIKLTIFGSITNINNDATQQCDDFLACNPKPVSRSSP